jgi:hypothetical protein
MQMHTRVAMTGPPLLKHDGGACFQPVAGAVHPSTPNLERVLPSAPACMLAQTPWHKPLCRAPSPYIAQRPPPLAAHLEQHQRVQCQQALYGLVHQQRLVPHRQVARLGARQQVKGLRLHGRDLAHDGGLGRAPRPHHGHGGGAARVLEHLQAGSGGEGGRGGCCCWWCGAGQQLPCMHACICVCMRVCLQAAVQTGPGPCIKAPPHSTRPPVPAGRA